MKPKQIDQITCRKCGAVIGNILEGELWEINGILISEAHGVCTRCGQGFHYSTKVQALQKLLDQVWYNRTHAEPPK